MTNRYCSGVNKDFSFLSEIYTSPSPQDTRKNKKNAAYIIIKGPSLLAKQVLPAQPVLRRCLLSPYVPLLVLGSANVPALTKGMVLYYYICRVFTFFTDYNRNPQPVPDLSLLLTSRLQSKGLHLPGLQLLPLEHFCKYVRYMSS